MCLINVVVYEFVQFFLVQLGNVTDRGALHLRVQRVNVVSEFNPPDRLYKRYRDRDKRYRDKCVNGAARVARLLRTTPAWMIFL